MSRRAFARRAGRLGTLAGALLLGGCMNLIPRYERPAAPVARAYAPELTPAGAPANGPNAAAPADIEWQRLFADPRLKRLIELSLANNRDLRVAVLNIEQARALYQVRRADELPSVGAGVTAQRQPGGNAGLVNAYAVGVQLTGYELDFFGRVRALSQAALAQYLATEEARKTAQIALIAGVATTYVGALADDELLRVTRESLKTREDSFRLTQLRFDNGASSEVDLRQAEQLLETAKVALAQTQRQRALDENALTLLVGQSLPTDLPAPLPLAAQQGVTDLPAGLPSDLLTRRPDVLAAEQQLLAANANIGAARARYFPSITLTGSVGVASNAVNSLFNAGTGTWAFAPLISLPIFDAGAIRAGVRVAEADRDILVARYEKAVQTAFREVSDALAQGTSLSRQVEAQDSLVQASGTSFELSTLRYEAGVDAFLSKLDAQRTYASARQNLIAARLAQVANQLTLYKVLGGGWPDS